MQPIVDVNQQDADGETPLTCFLMNCPSRAVGKLAGQTRGDHTQNLKNFFQLSMDPNKPNSKGKSPLAIAFKTKNHQAAGCLMRHQDIDFDILAVDESGTDPVSRAIIDMDLFMLAGKQAPLHYN